MRVTRKNCDLSNKFQLNNLKYCCLTYITSKIDNDGVVAVMNVAVSYGGSLVSFKFTTLNLKLTLKLNLNLSLKLNLNLKMNWSLKLNLNQNLNLNLNLSLKLKLNLNLNSELQLKFHFHFCLYFNVTFKSNSILRHKFKQ